MIRFWAVAELKDERPSFEEQVRIELLDKLPE